MEAKTIVDGGHYVFFR